MRKLYFLGVLYNLWGWRGKLHVIRDIFIFCTKVNEIFLKILFDIDLWSWDYVGIVFMQRNAGEKKKKK